MELTDALRTTGAVREFTDELVDDAALARVLDTARFAPSGGDGSPGASSWSRTPRSADGSAISI
jgi:nitroreductase